MGQAQELVVAAATKPVDVTTLSFVGHALKVWFLLLFFFPILKRTLRRCRMDLVLCGVLFLFSHVSFSSHLFSSHASRLPRGGEFRRSFHRIRGVVVMSTWVTSSRRRHPPPTFTVKPNSNTLQKVMNALIYSMCSTVCVWMNVFCASPCLGGRRKNSLGGSSRFGVREARVSSQGKVYRGQGTPHPTHERGV